MAIKKQYLLGFDASTDIKKLTEAIKQFLKKYPNENEIDGARANVVYLNPGQLYNLEQAGWIPILIQTLDVTIICAGMTCPSNVVQLQYLDLKEED